MKNISVYDIEESRLEKICETYNLTTAEAIEMMLDYIEGNEQEVFE